MLVYCVLQQYNVPFPETIHSWKTPDEHMGKFVKLQVFMLYLKISFF